MSEPKPDFDLSPLLSIVAIPFQFEDLIITLLDVIPAPHPADWEVSKHRHPWYEFNVLTQGAFYTSLSEEEFYTAAGRCFLIPPGAAHAHRFSATKGDDGFCLRWQLTKKLEGAENIQIDSRTARICSVLSRPRSFSFSDETLKLFQVLEYQRPRSILAVQSLFAEWLFSLVDQLDAEPVNPHVYYGKDQDKKLVQQTMLFLEAYYPQALKVEEIAVSLHISYRNLSRIFKRATGCTIVEKLNEIRINQAQKLLAGTPRKIKQIAKEVGYENEYYFSNLFRKHLLMSPSEFRSFVANKN